MYLNIVQNFLNDRIISDDPSSNTPTHTHTYTHYVLGNCASNFYATSYMSFILAVLICVGNKPRLKNIIFVVIHINLITNNNIIFSDFPVVHSFDRYDYFDRTSPIPSIYEMYFAISFARYLCRNILSIVWTKR